MDNKQKTVKKLMDGLISFKDMTIGESQDLIKSYITSAYSTGAYYAVKEIVNKFGIKHESKTTRT